MPLCSSQVLFLLVNKVNTGVNRDAGKLELYKSCVSFKVKYRSLFLCIHTNSACAETLKMFERETSHMEREFFSYSANSKCFIEHFFTH